MQSVAISPGRQREQEATEWALTTSNLRQTIEVKKKLKQLKERLERLIAKHRDKDPHLAGELQDIVDQVVVKLERLEEEDESRQKTQAAIHEFKHPQRRLSGPSRPGDAS